MCARLGHNETIGALGIAEMVPLLRKNRTLQSIRFGVHDLPIQELLAGLRVLEVRAVGWAVRISLDFLYLV